MIRRGEPKLETGPRGGEEHRLCAWPPCGTTFRPTIVLSGKSTEHFCSALCAYASLKARARRVRVILTDEED
jgi:hypothetical protein